MKRFSFAFVLLLLLLFACKQQENDLTVVFYNTENLFDTKDDSLKNDNEFLPESKKNWTEERYRKKLNDISRVLYEIDTVSLPVFIGLCEVENREVLEDLVATSALIPGNYGIIHQESPDVRGIDVALLYRKDLFQPGSFEAIPVIFEDAPDYKTRDILYASGTLKNETFHLFVNHWPSRIGGTEASEPRRVFAASVLKEKINEIQKTSPLANIIIMGDMNDEPVNKSLLEILSAQSPESNSPLVNLMLPPDEQNMGSYNYRGNWNMLDNIVVSHSLLDGNGLDAKEKQGHVFRKEWMEYKNKKGDVYPNRTYGGPNYYGGVSDHFPVYFVLKAN